MIQTMKAQLESLGCPADTFCAVAGFPQTKWTRALRGTVQLGGPELEKLGKIITAMHEITVGAKAIRPSFRTVEDLTTMLDFHRAMILWRVG